MGFHANAVNSLYSTATVSKTDIQKYNIRTLLDLRRFIIECDENPATGRVYRIGKHEEKAERLAWTSQNRSTAVDKENDDSLQIGFSCLEFTEIDDNDEYVDGSFYDSFAPFTDEERTMIKNVLGI